MEFGTVLSAGQIPESRPLVSDLVAEFGWRYEEAEGLYELCDLPQQQRVLAVMFNPEQLGMPWQTAVDSIRRFAPGALPILCHGFIEIIDADATAEAGVFHTLRIPFDEHEVRQSLGFVWSVRQQSLAQPLNRLSAVA